MKRLLPPGFSRAVPIGKGAFGTVYRARQDDLGRWVALKELPRGDKMARDEAQALAASPLLCLPTVYGLVSGRRSEWITMEYIHGVSLRDAISQGLESVDAASLATALVRSLGILHASGRAHGDFKPDNLIVEPDGKIRLVDLGLSADLPNSVQGGTVGYIAHEKGAAGCDARRADLWSLGVVLHEILVGARPTPSEGAGGWKRLKIAALDWVPLVDLLLREDATRRPASSDCLEAELPASSSPTVDFLEKIREQADRNLANRMVDEAACLLRDGSPSEALSLLQQALELDPDQSGALGLLPQIRLDRKNNPRRLWLISLIALPAMLVGLWGIRAIRHRPQSSSLRASLSSDSGAGERLRSGAGTEGRKVKALPLRESRGVEK